MTRFGVSRRSHDGHAVSNRRAAVSVDGVDEEYPAGDGVSAVAQRATLRGNANDRRELAQLHTTQMLSLAVMPALSHRYRERFDIDTLATYRM